LEGRSTQEHGTEALRSLLLAVRRLEAFAVAQEAHCDAACSTARSTRVLVKLMEGWCIDHAVRARHAALEGLARGACGDDAVLAALNRHFGR